MFLKIASKLSYDFILQLDSNKYCSYNIFDGQHFPFYLYLTIKGYKKMFNIVFENIENFER